MLRSLFWKEWHEHRWKVLFGSVMVAGCTAIGLRTRILPDEEVVIFCAVGGALLLPILAAMDLVAGERADGSLGTLLSLPVRSRIVLAVKMVVGTLTCIVPQAVAMIVAILIAGGREKETSYFVSVFAGGTAFGLCLVIWTVSLGIRQPSEARVALIGLALIFLWFLALPLICETLGWKGEQSARVLMVMTPLGFFVTGFTGEYDDHLPQLICTQVLVGAGLLGWAASRLGRPGRTRA